MHDFPPSLAAIVRRQHGLFTTLQAQQCELSRSTIDTLIRRGLVRRLDRGVYRHLTTPHSWKTDVLRYVLLGGSGAAASHRCAARLWGMDGYDNSNLEITVPRGRRLRRPGVRVHESTDLHRAFSVRRDGVPTPDLPRTILDLARRATDESLALDVQWCRREHGLTWAQLAATLRAHARRGRPGIRRLRRVIAAHAHRDEVSDSAFEDLTLALIAEHGLPEPVLHHRLRIDGRDVVLDLAYPALKVAIELDGGVHMEPSVFRSDRRRQNAIVLGGWLILRFTWDDYTRDPARIVREIGNALERRGAA